jgi:hypothetical protein
MPGKDTNRVSSAELLRAYILATALTPSLQVISESFSFSISLHTTSEEIESNVVSWCPPVRYLHPEDPGAAEEDRIELTQEAKRGTKRRKKGASISRLGSLASLADCGSKETLHRKRMTACQPPMQSLLSQHCTKPWGQSQWAGPKYTSFRVQRTSEGKGGVSHEMTQATQGSILGATLFSADIKQATRIKGREIAENMDW